jgi:hypothetical protein
MVKQGPTKNDPDVRKYFPTSRGKLSIFIFEGTYHAFFAGSERTNQHWKKTSRAKTRFAWMVR